MYNEKKLKEIMASLEVGRIKEKNKKFYERWAAWDELLYGLHRVKYFFSKNYRTKYDVLKKEQAISTREALLEMQEIWRNIT